MRHDQSTTRAMANVVSWCKLRGNCWYLPLCIRSQDCRSAGCLIRSTNPSPIELPPCFIDATWLANCPPIWLNSEEPAPLPLSGTCGRYLEKCFAEYAIACMFGCPGHPHAGPHINPINALYPSVQYPTPPWICRRCAAVRRHCQSSPRSLRQILTQSRRNVSSYQGCCHPKRAWSHSLCCK
jgi:hypothetical protein